MTSRGDAYAAFQRARDPAVARRAWLQTAKGVVTFEALCDAIEAIGGLLREHRVVEGDRVIIGLTDETDICLLAVGLICHGVTVVHIDPETPAVRAEALIRRARPALIVLDPQSAAAWPAVSVLGSNLVVETKSSAKGGGLSALFGARSEPSALQRFLQPMVRVRPSPQVRDSTLAYILFTSGTTNASKGVCISQGALFAHLSTLGRVQGLDEGSRIHNVLMLSHADGLVQGPLLSFFHLASLHRPRRFEVGSVGRLLDDIYQQRITHMIAVPTMLALLARLGADQHDAFQGGDFRYLVSCGAALEAGLWERIETLFGVQVINLYGLTETVSGGVFAGGPLGRAPLGSIGRPVDCALRIVDDHSQPVAGGETGELMMRGTLLMNGYFDDEGGTNAALDGGWLRTGDIARQDADGVYWICGRKKSVVIRGGLNIHPEEIVEALNTHLGVREAVAFGIPDPDWGEVVVAVVAGEPGITEVQLLEHCRGRLDPRKAPQRIVIVAELPKGRSGKVVLAEARALADVARTAPAQAEHTDVGSRVIAAAAQCFGLPPERLSLTSAPNNTPGWDSLAHLNLVFALEAAFSVKLSPREIMGVDSLGEAAAIIARK